MKTAPRLSAKRYHARLQAELDRILNLMEKEWGYRPSISVKVQPILLVTADFNMKGFAHKGARIYVRPETAVGKRKPHLVARGIAAEISGHRNTCKDCGIAVPPIYARSREYAEYPARHEQGSFRWWCGKRYPKQAFDTPPDRVEALLHPVHSRRLRSRLAAVLALETLRTKDTLLRLHEDEETNGQEPNQNGTNSRRRTRRARNHRD